MRTTVKLQHLHTDELRASFDVGIKGRGLAVMHDVDEYHPKNATKVLKRAGLATWTPSVSI